MFVRISIVLSFLICSIEDGTFSKCADVHCSTDCQNDAATIRLSDTNVLLECRTQSIVSKISASSTMIASSEPDDRTSFTMQLLSAGRDLPKPVDASGTITKSGKFIRVTKDHIMEEFSVSDGGIRQDFVVNKSLAGEGTLKLVIAVAGAAVSLNGNHVSIDLPSGKKLSYGQLYVTDARNKTLPSHFSVTSSDQITINVDDKNATYPIRIDPTISDADWEGMGVYPGANFTTAASAFLYCRGQLYAGGSFAVLGGDSVYYIAQWNGSAWAKLGTGMNNRVTGLAMDSSGNLYACGNFTMAGGAAANHIARWNGSAWSSLGTGAANGVNGTTTYCMAWNQTNGALYVGGDFTTAGGATAVSIAQWDGASWSRVGTTTGMNGAVRALVYTGGYLYAGGQFTIADTVAVAANYVARWNGTNWSRMSPGTAMNNHVYGMKYDGIDTIYVVGIFTTVDGVAQNRIVKHSISSRTWRAMGTGLNNWASDIVLDQSRNVYVTGIFTTANGVPAYYIARWSGGTWGPVGEGLNGSGYSLALDGNNSLWCSGSFTSTYNGSSGIHGIGMWNSTAWVPYGTGADSSIYAIARDSSGNMYIGGAFLNIGGARNSYLVKWDGSQYTWIGNGMNGQVLALAYHNGILYAGGSFTTVNGITVNYIAKWNGSAWSALASGASGVVRAFAFDSTGNLYAGGDFTSAGGVSAGRVAMWNGAAWSRVGAVSGITNGSVNTLMHDGTILYAGGSFTSSDGGANNRLRVAKWDGTAWTGVGSGSSNTFNNTVHVITKDRNNNIYFGGLFTIAGNNYAANRIVKWNSLYEWKTLGTGMDAEVRAMYIDTVGTLWASGNFTTAGGVPSRAIAWWNTVDSSWKAVGTAFSATGASINALSTDFTGTLYAGGNTFLKSAGGKNCSHLAKLNNTPAAPGNDIYGAIEEQTLSVTAPGVLSNDFDNNSDALSVQLVSQTSNGTVTLNGDGSFTYAPNANFFGADNFSYKVNDGHSYSVIATVTINVSDVNDLPSFSKGADVQVLEDASAQSVSNWATAIFSGQANESSQVLNFDITNTNASLFSVQPAISSSGLLTYTPAANAFGQATVSVRARDNGGIVNDGVDTSAWQTFTVTILSVNDFPGFVGGANVSLTENGNPVSINNWATSISPGPSNEASEVITFEIVNNNPLLFWSQPVLSSTGTLAFVVAPDSFGTASISVRTRDNGTTANGGADTSEWQNFTITVTPVNDQPSFTKGGDVAVPEDASVQSISGWATAIYMGRPNESSQTAHFDILTDNNGLFSVLPSVSSAGTLTFTPGVNASGSARVSVRVHDNGDTISGGVDTSSWQTFSISVTSINDPPLYTIGSNVTVLENAPSQTFSNWATLISAGPSNESSQVVTFDISNSNSVLFVSQPSLSSSGTLTFRGATGSYGNAVVSIRARDNGGISGGGIDTSTVQTFTISILPINHVPYFSRGADLSVSEDAVPQTFAAWASGISSGIGDSITGAQQVHFDISNNRPSLFWIEPTISAEGTLTFTPAPDSIGNATVLVRAHDNGGSSNGGIDTSSWYSVTISVMQVNDPPKFTIGPNQNVGGDLPLQTVTGWATALSTGPSNESAQQISFETTTATPLMFTSQPIVTPTGTLTFQTAFGAFGLVVVSIRARDNGGTAFNGKDSSEWQTFTINISSVSHSPSAPQNLQPVTGEAVIPTDTLRWDISSDLDPGDSIKYVIQVSTNQNFDPILLLDTVTANLKIVNTFAQHRLLRRGTYYYWRVKAFDKSNLSSLWSGGDSRSIVFLPAQPSVFELSTPRNDEETSDLTPTLIWNSAVCATADTFTYSIQISTTPLFSSNIVNQSGLTMARYTVTAPLTDNSTYYWSVKAFGMYGDTVICGRYFKMFTDMINDPPGLPAPLLPENNTAMLSGDTLSWSRKDGDPGDSLTYTIRLSTDPTFRQIATTQVVRNVTSARLVDLVYFDSLHNDHIYYWQVQATDPHGFASGFTNGQNYFIVRKANRAPSQPYRLWPDNNIAVAPEQFLRWSASDPDSLGNNPDVVHFTVTIDDNADFSSPLGITTQLMADSIMVSNLVNYSLMTDNCRYYWKVIPIDNHNLAGEPSSGANTFYFNSINQPPSRPGALTSGTTNALSSITWTASVDPDPFDTTIYILQLSSNSEFSELLSIDTTSSLSIKLLSVAGYYKLQNATRYHLRVCGFDGSEDESQWVVSTIQFNGIVPQTPANLGPVNGSIIYPTESLFWNRATTQSPGPQDYLKYIVSISITADFARTNLDDTTNDTSIILESITGYEQLVDNGTYFWRVRVFDNHQTHSLYSDVRRFLFDKSNNSPGAPQILKPLSGEIISEQNIFSWNSVKDPDPGNTVTYRMLAATDSLFNDTVLSVVSIPDTGCSFTYLKTHNTIVKINRQTGIDTGGLQDNHFYFWRVKTVDNHNASSPFSQSAYFYCNTVNDIPFTPYSLQPSFNSLAFPTVYLRWQDSTKNEYLDTIRYHVQLSYDSLFAQQIVIQDTVFYSKQIKILDLKGNMNLLQNRTIFWRVKSIDKSGQGSSFSPCVSLYYSLRNDPPEIPSEINPSVAASILLPSDQITWSKCRDPNGDSVYYTIWISNTPFSSTIDSSSVRIKANGLNSNMVVVKNISTGETLLKTDSVYYWRVVAYDPHLYSSAWSEQGAFTYRSTPPPVVELLLTRDSSIVSSSDTLFWTPVVDRDAGALDTIRYYVYIDDNPEFNSPVSVDTIQLYPWIVLRSTRGIYQLDNNVVYYWKVKALDVHGASGEFSPRGLFDFNKSNTQPDKPVNVKPVAMRIIRPFESLVWTAKDPDWKDTLKFRIEISRDTLFYNPVLVFQNYTNHNIPIKSFVSYREKLVNDERYYWHVQAVDPSGMVSSWSNPTAFHYFSEDHLASAPQLVKPLAQSYIKSSDTLYWSKSTDVDDSIIQYTLQVASDSDFNVLIIDKAGLFTVKDSLVYCTLQSIMGSASLVENKAYFWRVFPLSLVDTLWIPGNSSIKRSFWFGSKQISGNVTITTVTVITPSTTSDHVNIAKSTDNKLNISFSDSTVVEPIGIRITRVPTIDEAPNGTTDSVANRLQMLIDSANQFASGDNRTWYVKEPSYSLHAFYLSAPESSVVFKKSIFLQIAYNDTNHNGLVDGDERIPVSSLRVCRLNEESGRWEPVDEKKGSRNGYSQPVLTKTIPYPESTSNNRIGVSIDHFSVYTLIAYIEMKDPFGEFKVYPSPVRVNESPFANIAYRLNEDADIQIRIFSKTGGLVWNKTISAGEPGACASSSEIQIKWDLRNMAGRNVSSDVYLIKLIATTKTSGTTYNKQQLLGVIR